MTDDNAPEEAEYGLVLPFDTDEPEFVRGFEAGQLWERLERDHRADQIIHAENAEMVIRMAESKRMQYRALDLGNGWMQIVVAASFPELEGLTP